MSALLSKQKRDGLANAGTGSSDDRSFLTEREHPPINHGALIAPAGFSTKPHAEPPKSSHKARKNGIGRRGVGGCVTGTALHRKKLEERKGMDQSGGCSKLPPVSQRWLESSKGTR